MVPCASCCSYQSKYDQADHDEDLCTAKPELELSEEANAKIVDGDNQNQKKCHEASGPCGCRAMVFSIIEPELDDENCGNYVVWSGDYVFKPVVPA
jgi:hypothetical protein